MKEEPKQSTKDRILSETPESVKQKVREAANALVNKQETLEEARANSYIDFAKSNEDVSAYSFVAGWDKGAEWQQERMYSEEEVLAMLSEVRKGSMVTSSTNNRTYWDFDIKSEKKWFKQFKKK